MSNVRVSEGERVSYPFAVDNDLCVIRKPITLQFGYLLDRLHVGRVAPSTKNHGNLGVGIDVGRSYQCSCGIARESNKVHRDILSQFFQRVSAPGCSRDSPEPLKLLGTLLPRRGPLRLAPQNLWSSE